MFDWLDVVGRVKIDNYDNRSTYKAYASTGTLVSGDRGTYSDTSTQSKNTYADAITTLNKSFNDWSVNVNLGVSLSDSRYEMIGYEGGLKLINFFAVHNIDFNKAWKAKQSGWHDQTRAIFANAEIGWKSMIYLTATGRNDWDSRLAFSDYKSFFYPSIGLSAILTSMFNAPDWLTYLKVRGSYTEVGNSYGRFMTTVTYPYDEQTQSWTSTSSYPNTKLKPERTDSWEIGVDGTFFKDFKVSGSFYYANTYNQTFDPKITVSSGYSTLYVQTGYVRNLGVEGLLSYGHTWRDFGWNSNFTFSWNKNKIVELVKDYVHPETGEIVNKDRLELKGLGYTKFILKEGGTLGDLYTNADFIRDDKGYIQIDKNGDVAKTDNLPDIKLGSVFPKANLAWNNSFSYKGIYAGFQLSARLGGIVYSATQAALDQYGVSEASAAARDRGGVLVNGRSWVNAQQYYEIVATSSGLPQYYTYSATNLRLQEAHIGYPIPRKWLGNICDINVSVVGRNLWMIYCKAPFDPEAIATTSNFYQGIDYFMMPSTRNFGFNVKINF